MTPHYGFNHTEYKLRARREDLTHIMAKYQQRKFAEDIDEIERLGGIVLHYQYHVH